MIPLRDDIPSARPPVVNWVLIAMCLLAFGVQVTTPTTNPSVSERYGFIPARLSDPQKTIIVPQRIVAATNDGDRDFVVEREAAPAAVPPIVAMLTCVFLHGGVLHLVGNLWFLWIFGDNVEDRFGHLGFLLLYLATGFIASGCHYMSNPSSTIPTIGASGAIAGVMGAYLVSYPHARVLALVPLFVIMTTFVVPAGLFMTLWLGAQVFGVLQPADPQAGGVAWWAHIGGFAAGALATFVMARIGVIAPVNRRRTMTRAQRLRFR